MYRIYASNGEPMKGQGEPWPSQLFLNFFYLCFMEIVLFFIFWIMYKKFDFFGIF